jgi:hypothetical protein
VVLGGGVLAVEGVGGGEGIAEAGCAEEAGGFALGGLTGGRGTEGLLRGLQTVLPLHICIMFLYLVIRQLAQRPRWCGLGLQLDHIFE